MPKSLYIGTWYIYNYKRREFLSYHRKGPDGRQVVGWVPSMRTADQWKNPSRAEAIARILNREMGGMPCQAVSGMAAKCFEEMMEREAKEDVL